VDSDSKMDVCSEQFPTRTCGEIRCNSALNTLNLIKRTGIPGNTIYDAWIRCSPEISLSYKLEFLWVKVCTIYLILYSSLLSHSVINYAVLMHTAIISSILRVKLHYCDGTEV
jgi:hypothetical protein